MFRVQLTYPTGGDNTFQGIPLSGIGDGDAVAAVLRDVARRLTTGQNEGVITDDAGTQVGLYAFEPDPAELASDLADRIQRAREYLAFAAPGNEEINKADAILAGEEP